MNLLQRFRLLPLEHRRFGFWRSLCLSLATGLLLNVAWGFSGRGNSLPEGVHVGLEYALFLPAWLVPLLWNRRAVSLGAPGFWSVWAPRWRPLALGAMVVAALISLGLALEGRRAEQAWREVEDHLRQRGEPLSYQELMGPPIPAEQNFAAHPFLSGIHAYTQSRDTQGHPVSRWTGQPRVTEIEASLAFPYETAEAAGRPLRRTGRDLEALARLLRSRPPLTPGTSRNARADAAGSHDDLSHLPVPPADMPAPQAVLFALEGLRDALEQIAEAARRPHCRHELNSADFRDASLARVALYKPMADRFRLRAMARLAVGDPKGAAEDIETILRLGEHLDEDSALMSHLVRIVLQGFAYNAFWEGTSQHLWSDSQLAAFQQRFATSTLRTGLVGAFQGERLFGQSCIERERQGRLDPATLGTTEIGKGSSGGRMPDAWLLQNQAYHARMLDRVVDVLQRSDPNRCIAAKGSIWETQQIDRTVFDTEGRRLHPYRILIDPMLPALGRMHTKTDQCLSINRLAITVAALERHRLGTGGYPKTLGDLVPRFLTTVPLDPMDGQPQRYRLNTDGTFTLYSVGPNHTDDGGVMSKSKDAEHPDWVWPPNHPTDERRLF